MDESLERPASCVRQISREIGLSAGSSAGGNLRIDAVAMPHTMALTVLGVMRGALRTMGRGPLRRQTSVGCGHKTNHPEQGTDTREGADNRSLNDRTLIWRRT